MGEAQNILKVYLDLRDAILKVYLDLTDTILVKKQTCNQ